MRKFFQKFKSQIIPLTLKRYFWRRFLTSSDQAEKSNGQIDADWRSRIDDVLACPDNAFIRRVSDAGKIEGYHIVMHNGVKVCVNGYYGEGIANMLIENRGVHEPQEEKAFEEVISLLPSQCRMIELGAYWGFYSLSLLDKHPLADCILVEPEPFNLLSGEINFELNGRQAKFIQAKVGAVPKAGEIVSVDALMRDYSIEHLEILHADIQGFEFEMLKGAENSLKESKIDYIFISTHSDDLHAQCIKELVSYRYHILASADLAETFSYDGLIVARREGLSGPDSIKISKKESH